MLRIGIDASRATPARRSGTEAYSLGIIRALLELDSPHDWRLYLRDTPPPDLFPAAVSRSIIRPRRLWTHIGLSAELRRRRPDRLFIPAHVLPLFHPCPTVVTIHDLGYLRFPESHPLGQRLYLHWSTRFSARSATALIADSEATRRDLVEGYAIPPEKITVVYPGLNPALKPLRHPAQSEAALRRYNLPKNFLLHVGTIQPRKNLERLIEAAQAARTPLVLAGRRGWLSDSIYEKGRAGGVIFLDYVADDDLPALYSRALAYAAPSLHEGFGFTVLEAMACGAPVICSDGGSLPEVAGQAAIIVPALDTQALAEAIRRVAADDALRQTMIMNGFRNISRFTWRRAAEQTLRVIESAGAAAF